MANRYGHNVWLIVTGVHRLKRQVRLRRMTYVRELFLAAGHRAVNGFHMGSWKMRGMKRFLLIRGQPAVFDAYLLRLRLGQQVSSFRCTLDRRDYPVAEVPGYTIPACGAIERGRRCNVLLQARWGAPPVCAAIGGVGTYSSCIVPIASAIRSITINNETTWDE